MCSCGCWLSSERTQFEPTLAALVTSTKRRAGLLLLPLLVLPLVLTGSSAHGTIGGGDGASGMSGGSGAGAGGRRRFARDRPLLPAAPTRKHLPPPSLEGAACQMNARHSQLTRPSLGRTRLQAAKRCTVVLPRPVSDSSMLQVTNAAAVGRQPCEVQAACVKHGTETLARHAHPRIAHHREPQGDCRTLLRRCRGCGSRRCWRWSSLRWWCHRPHPQPRLQSSSHQQQQRRDGQGIPTHVRVETPPALRSALSARAALAAKRARTTFKRV
eukprot:scaffold5350_cov75-Phaeocystis_antarctica.AAC.4